MRNVCANILSGDDSADITGGKVDANQLVSASFMAYFGDSTAAGTFKIQASNDPCPAGNLGPFTPTNWVDVPSATVSIASGASALITIANMTYRWVRAVYVRTSGGSTTMNVNMNGLSV